MRIVFLGSGAFGIPTLAHLARAHEVVGVVSQPDKPAGRGGQMTPTPIAAWAKEHLPGVPLVCPEKVNAAEIVAQVRGWAADAWVVIAFGQKLGKALLADRFAINLHASLLPRWRGAAPINAAMVAGDEITGNSVITLAEKMDAGLVLGTTTRPVPPDATAGEVHDLLAADGPEVVERVLQQHASGTLTPVVQDETLVTIAGKMSKDDGWVDFTRGGRACRQRVHGLTPWPGVTVKFREQGLKLLRVREHARAGPAGPGKIVDPERGLVRCDEQSVLELIEVQPAGKKAMKWADFCRGARVAAGEQLVGRMSEQ